MKVQIVQCEKTGRPEGAYIDGVRVPCVSEVKIHVTHAATMATLIFDNVSLETLLVDELYLTPEGVAGMTKALEAAGYTVTKPT